MGRAPCCEKTGLKKGPWTTQEDQILISFIQQNGHPNWRALPKQAGLLRCGKSCRLRWINYLRPDIKRGNYTVDEEKTIIKLHEMLGNRWSAIAAKLPGRTDNEIKNVWHTHLKKKVKKSSQEKSESCSEVENPSSPDDHDQSSSENYYSSSYSTATDNSITTAETMNNNTTTTTVDQAANIEDPLDFLPVIDDFFWSDSSETVDQNIASLPFDDSTGFEEFQYQVEDSFISGDGYGGCTPDVKFDEDMDYWYNILVNAGGTQERSCFN